MSVYVNELFEYGGSDTFKWTESCHMFTDGDVEELNVFAEKIGLRRSWLQGPYPHYDLTKSKRRTAVRAGAIEDDGKLLIRLRKEFIAQQRKAKGSRYG